MKKRLLSALLALALVFVLLPTTALAEVTTGKDYDISINGKGYKFDSDGSNGYITAYYYGNSPSKYFFSTKADDNWTTNSNLMLTKKGNTVTITIRSSKYSPSYESPQFTLKKESTEINDVPCIEMGNDNNLVITGKGTLNITRNENKSYGAALYSNVGDITINGGITVNVSFLNGKDYYNKNVSSNAIYVGDNHNLTVSGSGTNVIATNQGFHSSPATVCVEGGTITVSGGASLSATNTYDDNRSGSDDVKIQHFNSYAISGTKSNPCTLIVADEKSSVTATTNDFTNIAESWAFKYTTIQAAGATIKAGSSVSNSTVTTIDNISGQRYAKISIPALQRTSDVLIAGKDAVVGVETSIPSANGSGTYFYDQASKTLTLKDVNIASSSIINAIQFAAAGTYTINLVGTNTISDVSNGISVTDDKYITSLNVTITGTGSLDISARGLAINMKKGDLKFENTGEIKLTTSNISPTHNVLSVSGNITIADMEKYKVEGIVQDNTKDGGDTVTLSEASHLKGYQNPDGTAICLKTITITPTPAKDSTISYGKKTLKQGEIIKGEISGTATVATKGNTITLNNFKGTQALSFDATLADSTLVLEGTNTLSSIVTTQKGLTISGSGSLTVGSIRVTNNDNISADLTITGGAHVTVNRPSSEDEPAVEVSGNLTVTGDGTQLSAECTAATNPAIEVGGNASFTGSTVTITNNSDRQGKSGEYSYEVSTGLYVGGTLDIKNAAKVTSTVIGGNAIYAKGDITISGDSTEVNAQNSAYKFSAISTNGTVNISDNSTVKAENLKKHQGDPTGVTDPSTGKTYNACPAITGKIANKNSQNKLHIAGFTTSSAGSQNPTEGTPLYLDIAPGSVEPYIHHYYVTITRGDEVAHTESPIVIAGTTLLNDTYYTITDGSTVVANGSKGNYNAIYDSASKTLKLNNAQISHSFAHENGGGRDGAIIFKEFENYFIELSGENTISSTNTYAINCHRPDRTLTIKNAAEAENAKLTLTSNWMVICSIGGLNIQSDVTMVNTKEAGYLMYVNDTFSFDGYNAYASVNASGSPLVEYTVPTSGDKDAGYQYLRITKETLETGGGSTHQHVWDEAWHDTGDYHHAHQCTICKAYDTTTQELHNVTGHRDNHDGSHSNICGSCGYSAKVSHSYTWAPNANDNEKHIGTCVCGNVVEKNHNFVGDVCSDCGYDKSTGTTCEHVWTTEWTIDTVDNEYHWHKCIKCNAITDKKPHAYTIVTDSGTNHIRECECKVFYVEDHISSDWIIDAPATPTTAGSMHKECTVCKHKMQTEVIPATGEIVPPTPDNPGTIVIIRPAEEEKPAQQPNPSTGANDLVGLAVAAAVAAALGSAALLRKHD